MALRKQSKINPEGKKNSVIKKMKDRPFPLKWGLLTLALFGTFAVVTQLQFSRVADDRLFSVKQDTYLVERTAYAAAQEVYKDCLATAERVEAYLEVFNGIGDLFDTTAELPASLFPESEEAVEYRDTLKMSVDDLIDARISNKIDPQVNNECELVVLREPMPPRR